MAECKEYLTNLDVKKRKLEESNCENVWTLLDRAYEEGGTELWGDLHQMLRFMPFPECRIVDNKEGPKTWEEYCKHLLTATPLTDELKEAGNDLANSIIKYKKHKRHIDNCLRSISVMVQDLHPDLDWH